MLIKFGTYELDIKARSTITNEDFNDQDTFFFLNELAIIAEEAARQEKANGYEALAKSCKNASKGVYSELKKLGFYDRVVSAC